MRRRSPILRYPLFPRVPCWEIQPNLPDIIVADDPGISTRQYAHLVDELVILIVLQREDYWVNSLHRNKVSNVYKQSGRLRAGPCNCAREDREHRSKEREIPIGKRGDEREPFK